MAAQAGAGGVHRCGADDRAVEHIDGVQADRVSGAEGWHLQPHRRARCRQCAGRGPEETGCRLQRGNIPPLIKH